MTDIELDFQFSNCGSQFQIEGLNLGLVVFDSIDLIGDHFDIDFIECDILLQSSNF